MKDFLKALRAKLFMEGMDEILKTAIMLRKLVKRVSMLTDCTKERFSEILVDVVFNDKPLEGFSDELGIEIPKTEEEEE